ncbi:HD domain-containing protein [Anoxybacterium hadale]|uniref:HD domain-containing protein n=1 Tax=Anoxybacterium hadale TaxID=3408580 RepID=A0ACD1A8R9_9FIRM|nr:HD domain-containing protein [Clostridiales bacterium]
MQCTDKNLLIDYINSNMTEKRRIHTYAVAEEAVKLARRYGEDVEKAELAALFHDFFRGISVEELNGYVKAFGLNHVYLNNNNLAHGKIAAIVMERDYHITDQDIINAVSFHTTGRAEMSLLEKIVYLADAIEPNRAYPGVNELRDLATKDLDKACLLSLNRNIEYIRSRGIYLDEDTLQARDSLLKKIRNQ